MKNVMLFIFLLIGIYILKLKTSPTLEFMEDSEYEKYRDPYTSNQRFDRGGLTKKIWIGDAMNSGNETIGKNRFYNVDNNEYYYWYGDYKYYEPPQLDWIYID